MIGGVAYGSGWNPKGCTGLQSAAQLVASKVRNGTSAALGRSRGLWPAVKKWSYDQQNRYYGTRHGIDIREIFIRCIA